MNDNPLWALPDPFTFDSVTADHVVPAAERLVAEATAKIAALVASDGPRGYADTFGAYEDATSRLERCMLVCEHMENASSSDAFRAAWGVAQPKITTFWSELPLVPGLYEAMQAAYARRDEEALAPLERRHAEKTLADFVRRGASLDAADKKKLVEIDVALSAATTKFMQNALDATNAYELYVEDEGRLAGLPPHAVEGARRAAAERQRSGFRFSLQAPSFLPVITYADDERLRKEMFLAYNARAAVAPFDNVPVIREVLALRQRKAKLLGFANVADHVLEDRMAKSGERARAFVRDLAARTRPFFEKERADLVAFAARPLQAWDTGYYANKLREARHAFDDEALRPYLPLESVLGGAFEVMRRLYGVRFVATRATVWHESVRPFAMESEDGKLLANVYLDLFPRESKVQGAWMAPLRVGSPGDPKRDEAHQAVVCANFTPPSGDAPALLNHREVETLFHELGHLMHQCLSRVPIRSLAGTNVAWDFVELPSQIMENWTWELETLRMFARHHETQAPLPQDLFDRLVGTRTFRAASAQMQQLGYAELDFTLHCDFADVILDPAAPLDVLGIGRKVMQEHVSAPLPDDYAMITSFGHLFGNPVGYAAGYYSYKWAEVLDADAFGRFRDEGVLAREVGERFRQKILERGAAAEPEELFRDFMGRDPRPDALLERQGMNQGA